MVERRKSGVGAGVEGGVSEQAGGGSQEEATQDLLGHGKGFGLHLSSLSLRCY